MIDAPPNTTVISGKELPSQTWQRWFRSLFDLLKTNSTTIAAMQAEIESLKARVSALE